MPGKNSSLIGGEFSRPADKIKRKVGWVPQDQLNANAVVAGTILTTLIPPGRMLRSQKAGLLLVDPET
jgi:hypothetical protein